MMAMSASRYDVARFGAEVFRGSPRPGGLMIVAGRLSRKMARCCCASTTRCRSQVRDLHGACASVGGVFDNYASFRAWTRWVPVDAYVPAVRLRPESLIYGIVQLQKKIERTKVFA